MSATIATIYRACAKECGTFRDSRPAYFSKFKCAASLLDEKQGGFCRSDVYVIWDGPENTLSEFIKLFGIHSFHAINEQNNAASFQACLNLIDKLSEHYQGFFLTEDDHLYLPQSFEVFKEGLAAFPSDCVALGDHFDRYRPGNVDMPTRTDIAVTKHRHWRAAESYVLSFGFSSQFWRTFRDRLFHYASTVSDRAFFQELITRGRCLRTPMPAMSTHMENWDLSPVIDWEAYSREIVV